MQAGPGTIAEAMIRGLPIILNGYIAGQVSSTLKPSHFMLGSGFQIFGVFDCERRRQGMYRTWWRTDVGNSQNHQKRYRKL